MDTLAFGCILPATGRIRDFHPLERALAERTTKQNPPIWRVLLFYHDLIVYTMLVSFPYQIHQTYHPYFDWTTYPMNQDFD